ncbi:MAG: hypothetical protein KIT83_06235 [Bryobacterales bacterium]|nr:hypothetical protein [Bryobacterales bacterium]
MSSVLALIANQTKRTDFADKTVWASVDFYKLVQDGRPMAEVRRHLYFLGTLFYRFQKWDGVRMLEYSACVDLNWFFGGSYQVNVRPR